MGIFVWVLIFVLLYGVGLLDDLDEGPIVAAAGTWMIICPGRISTIVASNVDRCCQVAIVPRRAATVAGFGLFSGLRVLRARFTLRV